MRDSLGSPPPRRSQSGRCASGLVISTCAEWSRYLLILKQCDGRSVRLVMKNADAALLELGRGLKEGGYAFVTVTPEPHRRVTARGGSAAEAQTLRDVFGWNRRFRAATVGPHILDLLHQAEALGEEGGLFTSRIRFSTYRDFIFLHSGYPTLAANSVFFGPDTYRFLAALECGRAETHPGRAIDIGAGSGAAGIDSFAALAQRELLQSGLIYTYAEIDPDVFGEELESGVYAKADRIAAVMLTVAAP